jgi:O-antigen/teichoic acid export membrane protein
MMSEQFGGTDGAATARTLRIGIGLNAFVCIPAGVILLILSPYIMALYGAEFEAGSGTMDIVVLTAMLLAVQAPVGQVIAASGRMWMGAAMNLGWAFVFLFSTYLLVSSGYGAFGLALGRGIAYLVHAAWTLGYAVIVLRQAGKQSQRRSELCGEY